MTEPWVDKALKDLHARIKDLEQRQDYFDKALASIISFVPPERQQAFRDEFWRLTQNSPPDSK